MLHHTERTLMNIRQLQYAVELSRSLNFSQVACRLGISQPALSKQILALEKELDLKLFDRSTTPLTLTPAGEYFIREAEKLLWREEQLLRSMEEFKAGQRGTLSVGISPFRSQYLMPRIARELKRAYPEVRLILHEEDSETLRREAAEGKYDFAIVNLPVDESELSVTPLEDDTLCLAVPEGLLHALPAEKKEADSLALSDCRALDFVLLGESQEMRRLLERAAADAGFHPRCAVEVVGLTTAWAMCRAGVGAALLPRRLIEEIGGTQSVRLFSLEGTVQTRHPVIVRRRGAHLTDYARFCIELLEKQNG